MTIYRSGKYKLSFSIEMNRYLNAHQQDFMQEDTQAGMIYAYLEDYTGDRVCSKQLYEEALCLLYTSSEKEACIFSRRSAGKPAVFFTRFILLRQFWHSFL